MCIFFFQELILCSMFTFYYGILSALAPNYIWLLILRGLVGFGIGGVPQSYVSAYLFNNVVLIVCVCCVCVCVCVSLPQRIMSQYHDYIIWMTHQDNEANKSAGFIKILILSDLIEMYHLVSYIISLCYQRCLSKNK